MITVIIQYNFYCLYSEKINYNNTEIIPIYIYKPIKDNLNKYVYIILYTYIIIIIYTQAITINNI